MRGVRSISLKNVAVIELSACCSSGLLLPPIYHPVFFLNQRTPERSLERRNAFSNFSTFLPHVLWLSGSSTGYSLETLAEAEKFWENFRSRSILLHHRKPWLPCYLFSSGPYGEGRFRSQTSIIALPFSRRTKVLVHHRCDISQSNATSSPRPRIKYH